MDGDVFGLPVFWIFSLIGILAYITKILANNKIGVFAVSTFTTDYIFVKDHHYENAVRALKSAGYRIGKGKGAE